MGEVTGVLLIVLAVAAVAWVLWVLWVAAWEWRTTLQWLKTRHWLIWSFLVALIIFGWASEQGFLGVAANDDEAAATNARLEMLRVILPGALLSDVTKADEERVQELLGGDLIESPDNRIALFKQLRGILIATYKDNQELLANVNVTAGDKSDLYQQQKRIIRAVDLVGPTREELWTGMRKADAAGDTAAAGAFARALKRMNTPSDDIWR